MAVARYHSAARSPLARHCRWLLSHTHVVVGWLFNISFSLGLVYCSTWLVVHVAPEAGGAGVAEVMAYLNGCFMPKASGGCAGGGGQAVLLKMGWGPVPRARRKNPLLLYCRAYALPLCPTSKINQE